MSDTAARQDAREARKWVNQSHEARHARDGPPPSQRAADSLSAVSNLVLFEIVNRLIDLQLIELAENADVCRHVASFFIVLTTLGLTCLTSSRSAVTSVKSSM